MTRVRGGMWGGGEWGGAGEKGRYDPDVIDTTHGDSRSRSYLLHKAYGVLL